MCYARVMRPARPLHRVTIGRTRELRGPDALERGFVGLIIAAGMVVAVCFGGRLIRMSQSLEAVSLSVATKIDAVVHHTVHGRWPRPDTSATKRMVQGTYATNLSLGRDGVITAHLTLDASRSFISHSMPLAGGTVRGTLAFRPELLGVRGAATITYLCGYAKPVSGGVEAIAANTTTLARHDLPPFCR